MKRIVLYVVVIAIWTQLITSGHLGREYNIEGDRRRVS